MYFFIFLPKQGLFFKIISRARTLPTRNSLNIWCTFSQKRFSRLDARDCHTTDISSGNSKSILCKATLHSLHSKGYERIVCEKKIKDTPRNKGSLSIFSVKSYSIKFKSNGNNVISLSQQGTDTLVSWRTDTGRIIW